MIVGLAGVTVLTRCFFFILDRPWSLPGWASARCSTRPWPRLAGVVAPEVVMLSGHLVATWQDARLFAAPVGRAAVLLAPQRAAHHVAGMAVYLPLHLGLGW